ncbi:hypothetical protein DV735_g3500, partial [Chaetothyriales sp. CBS 134920]
MNGENYSSRDGGRPRDHYQSSRHDRDDRRGERDRGERRDRGGDRGDRRRSRSPHHRSGARRDYTEPDSYSSSRDYRAREREERYDQEDRNEFAEQARKGRSPPPKKREPTPDLTGVVSVLERKRRMTQWDIKPPGYENVTAEQAKMSGMFPLPGAPRQQAMDPSKLQAFINQPQSSATTTALRPSNARQSKRLFVYNLPAGVSESDVVDFFNLQLNGLTVVKSTDPCVSAHVSTDNTFALLEFKQSADATMALALDGITMEQHHAAETNGNGSAPIKGLDIRRPKDYIVPSADPAAYTAREGELSSEVPDSANKICVSNLPTYLTDEQVVELLKSFGDLRAFAMVRDSSTGESRGIAFCEYLESSATEIAVEGLNDMELGETRIKVVRASIGFTQASGLELGVQAMSMFAGTQNTEIEGGRVLQLLNMVTAEELIDNEDFQGAINLLLLETITDKWIEICEDVQEECSKYGTIVEMKIPRPSGGSRQSAGVGKIYLKYETSESAKKALDSLAGRQFANRTVVVTYFDEASFDVNAW